MDTLFKTQAELRAFVNATVGLELDTLAPHLRNSAPEAEIIKIISLTVYNALLTAYADDTLSADQAALLPYVQKPLANLAVYSFVKAGAVNISDAGVTLGTDRDKSAFQWQQNNLETALLGNAYFSLDSLLNYMLANKAKFTGWDGSSEYALNLEFFINNAVTFNNWVNIKENYRTLITLRPAMRHIENSIVKPNMGQELFDLVKTQIKAVSVDDDNKALLAFIEPAVAHLTIARAIEFLSIDITPGGAYFNSLAGNYSDTAKKDPAKAETLAHFAEQNRLAGMAQIENLRQYLNTNASADKYATYFSTDLYQDPTTVVYGYDQVEDSKIYNAL